MQNPKKVVRSGGRPQPTRGFWDWLWGGTWG